jgi:hypothetical protein
VQNDNSQKRTQKANKGEIRKQKEIWSKSITTMCKELPKKRDRNQNKDIHKGEENFRRKI